MQEKLINKSHGGARNKAGRKPIEDKKVMLSIYPQQSRLNVLGVDTAKSIAITAIEKEYLKNLKKT